MRESGKLRKALAYGEGPPSEADVNSGGVYPKPAPDRRVLVKDTHSDHDALVEHQDVAETIRPWYPDAPTEVLGAIALLQRKLNAHEYTGDEETYLGISIDLTGGGGE